MVDELDRGPDPCLEVVGVGRWLEPSAEHLGERRLGSLPVRTLDLANPWLLERHSEAEIAAALQALLGAEAADLIALGEIPEDSALRRALGRLSWPCAALALGRKESLRWLIDLPESLDAYFAGLSSSTRQSTRRKMRKLEKDFDVRLEIVTDPGDVARYLEEGEKISRLTYQWNVGQRLLNDADSQRRHRELAEEGRLRCYLLSLDGTVRAFLRGTVEGPVYHYETPGFDPEFGRTSIGTILLIYALRDLIENTSCRIFDFGVGGDETGYKSKFGTRSLRCNSWYVVRLDRPRGLAVWAGQHGTNTAKNLADVLLRNEKLRRAVKQRLRRYGD